MTATECCDILALGRKEEKYKRDSRFTRGMRFLICFHDNLCTADMLVLIDLFGVDGCINSEQKHGMD